MSLRPGARLRAYEVLGLVGSGGMGVVYRARDMKLGRDVALKILPESFALDRDRLVRFKREAQLLASLNHPNIATIHGIEEENSIHALVLEFVEGPTLADRISQGAMPLGEALAIARQIAEALEAAHECGVIHRDLKPANIKIRDEGLVKVLDFGLAKTSRGAGDPSEPPSLTDTATAIQEIVGTPAYMAPEQAKGRAVDKRADVWAFGAVLFEMLSGHRAFGGDSVPETLARVIEREPDFTTLPATVPLPIRRLLRRCLAKDPRERLRDIADARFTIEETLNESDAPTAAVTSSRTIREWLWPATVAGIAILAGSVAAAWYFRGTPVETPESRLQIVTPPAAFGSQTQFAISPDGRQVVLAATTDGKTQLWLRRLEDEVAKPVAGTDGARYPFWSPDGRSIGFFAAQKLKRIGIAGGTALTLADAGTGDDVGTHGGTWNADGTVLFAPFNPAAIYRVPANGGEAVQATRIESRQMGHRFPFFLPDGRHFLFFATGAAGVQGVYVGSLDGTDARRLFDADTAAVFAPPDYVLFVRQENLFAQRLDLEKLEPVGDAFPVADRVVVFPANFASVALSASSAGPWAYRTQSPQPRQLVWVDRTGRQTGTIGEPDTAELGSVPRISPDGGTVAVTRRVAGNTDVWLIDTTQGLPRRFTFDPVMDLLPTWSSDGSHILFHSARKGGGSFDLYRKAVTGAGTEEVLLESPDTKNILDASSDGRFILYSSQSQNAGRDLWVLPLSGDRKPFAVVQTSFDEYLGRFSPDSRWIAFQSSESGRNEVYVTPFPGPGPKARISADGGVFPQWRADGREIFYQAPDDRLMAVPILLGADGGSVTAGRPAALFGMRRGSFYAARDGQRFLINMPLADAVTPPITIVLNWKPPDRK